MTDKFWGEPDSDRAKWENWSYQERPKSSARTNYVSAIVFAASTLVVLLDSAVIV